MLRRTQKEKMQHVLFVCSLICILTLADTRKVDQHVKRHRDPGWNNVFSDASPTVPLRRGPQRKGFVYHIQSVHTSLRNASRTPIANEDLLNFHNSQVINVTTHPENV